MDNVKVTVNIFDRDYTISGGKNKEQVLRAAVHVDSKMREIGEALKNCSISDLAVLAAVNISDEHFEIIESKEALERIRLQLENDSRHYVQLWEEAKNTFVTYKEDSQNEIKAIKQQKDRAAALLHDKEREIEELMRRQNQAEKDRQEVSQVAVSEVEAKYKDLENNFFDLQMENIQLKSELEKLKSKLEWERNERENR